MKINSKLASIRGLGLLVLGTTLLLSGCTSASPAVGLTAEQIKKLAAQEQESGHDEQFAALADGAVDRGEYRAAFENLGQCLVEKGYPPPQSWTNPVDGYSLIFEMKDGGTTREQKETDTASCIDVYWETVSAAYIANSPKKMDDGLRVASVECMRAGGYELRGDENTVEELGGPNGVVDARISDRANKAIECLAAEQTRLFPEIPVSQIAAY